MGFNSGFEGLKEALLLESKWAECIEVEALEAGGHKHNTQKKAINCRQSRNEQKLEKKKDTLRGMGEGLKLQYRRRNYHQIEKNKQK